MTERVELEYDTPDGKLLHVTVDIPVGGKAYAHQVAALMMKKLPRVHVIDENYRLSATATISDKE